MLVIQWMGLQCKGQMCTTGVGGVDGTGVYHWMVQTKAFLGSLGIDVIKKNS